jgi:hypothetical protein
MDDDFQVGLFCFGCNWRIDSLAKRRNPQIFQENTAFVVVVAEARVAMDALMESGAAEKGDGAYPYRC